MAAESSTVGSSSRFAGGGASADSYIGSLISLTSKSELRYEGILYNINTKESSIGLRNVRSFGTECQKKDGPQIPPSDKIYDYILYRGSDIKDLQVKVSPPVQIPPPVNSDPAIIQSHYTRPATQSANLSSGPGGSLADLGSHSSRLGLPGSTFHSGLPLFHPGVPNASGSGIAVPMYWQGFYGAPNGLPQLPRQSLFRPPPGLAIPPSMQLMHFSSFNSSLPMEASSLTTSNLPEYHSSFVSNCTGAATLISTSLTSSSLSCNVHPRHPVPPTLETMTNLLPNKAPISAVPASTPTSNLQFLSPFSGLAPDNAGVSSVANKPTIPGPVPLSQWTISQSLTSVALASGSVLAETSTPSHITPGQLLQSGQTIVSSPQPLLTTQKDVEVVQVLPKPSSELSVPAVTEAQPPRLPLLPNTRAYKTACPVAKCTEEFDFMAMNEKFNKNKVWGYLGKSNLSQSRDKVVNESGSDEYDSPDEYDAEVSNIEIKPVYKKYDFFDTLSCNTLDNDTNHGQTRYSEQMKLDAEIGKCISLEEEVEVVVGFAALTMVEEVMVIVATRLGVVVEVCIPRVVKHVLCIKIGVRIILSTGTIIDLVLAIMDVESLHPRCRRFIHLRRNNGGKLHHVN